MVYDPKRNFDPASLAAMGVARGDYPDQRAVGAEVAGIRVGPLGELMIRVASHSEVLQKQIAVLDQRLQFASRPRGPRPVGTADTTGEARAAVSPLADELERIDERLMNALENLRAITEALEL